MDKISRRDFIKVGAGIVATMFLPRYFTGSEVKSDKGPVIGVAYGNREKLVTGAIEQIGGIERFVKSGGRVLIKPNISFAANAECGATTSAEIVKQIVQLCLNAGAGRVIIVDYPLANAEICIEKSGIKEALVDKTKINILMLSKERQFYEVEIHDGKALKTVKIAKELNNVDTVINVPTAKSHSATGVSLGMKNLMGLIWDRSIFHRGNLHQAIAELATVIKPHLTIVDATRALTSGGPGGPGRTVILNTVIAGADIVAVDSYTTGITQWYNKSFSGKNVKHIVVGYEIGLGEIDTEKMQIKKVEV